MSARLACEVDVRHRDRSNDGSALDLAASRALLERAERVIPGQTNTISKRVTAFATPDVFPAYVARADGATVHDVDGNAYLDYIAALAPVVLGYNIPRVNARIRDQLSRGVLFSLPTAAEVELSELLVDIVPCAESVRLMKSGAEAASAAVRVSRAYTGRDIVLCCGYHGWHDWWAGTKAFRGVPAAVAELTRAFEFDDLAGARALFDRHGRDVACVIVTPALYGRNPTAGFLAGLRELTERAGAVLIFDEIITGFRWALGGAQQRYAVRPDLAVLGKAMANGMPIAALVGDRTLMASLADNWVSSTYASEALSIVAALETIAILRDTDALETLERHARRIDASLEIVARDSGVPIRRFDPLPALRFELESLVEPPAETRGALNAAFITGCARRGVLIRHDGSGFSMCLMAALTDADVDRTLDVFVDALTAARRLAA